MRRFLVLFILPLFAFGQYPALCTNDSLSAVEQEIAKNYPFVAVQCNQFQFFGTESPNWLHLNSVLTK